MPKMRIGVIMGGKSQENEISFNSGRTVCDHLDSFIYDIIPILQTRTGLLFILPWHFLHRGKITDFEHRLTTEAQPVLWDNLSTIIDFMFIAMPGKYAEDGTLQGMLELLGIPYLGSNVFASALSMDKIMQKKILAQHHIKTPRSLALTPTEIMNFDTLQETIKSQLTQAGITLPVIVKPYKEGSSLGVTCVTDYSFLHSALIYACTIHNSIAQNVLIEEKIEGMEFSCTVLTNITTGQPIPLPPTEIIIEHNTSFYDYHQKYMPGRAHKRTPPHCSPDIIKKIQDTCVTVMKALGLTNLCRIDGFVTPTQEIVIIDPNSLPGLDPASFLFREAAEISLNHSQVISHLIETELHYYTTINSTTNTSYLSSPIPHDNTQSRSPEKPKIRVAVLMAGDSNEKEISLASGRNVTYKLSSHKYQVIPLFVDDTMKLYHINQQQLVQNTTQEIKQLLTPEQNITWAHLPTIADFVFIALHGGKGENGSVQGALEMLELPYNGSSVLASSLCMDKYKTAQFLQAHGFDVPTQCLIDRTSWHNNQQIVIDTIEQTIPYPAIVKPSDDGCSVMVEKVTNREQIIRALNTIFAHQKTTALIEEYILGMELTVGVLGNTNAHALPPSQTVVQKDILSIEEKFLPGAGENQTPAPLSPEAIAFVQQTVTSTYTALGCCGYARIDCFYQAAHQSPTGKQRVIILEINTLPGLTPATCLFHQAAEINIKPMELIDTIIELGFEQYRNNHTHYSTLRTSCSENQRTSAHQCL